MEHLQDAFGVNFWLLNVGIGLGAIIGTQIAEPPRPAQLPGPLRAERALRARRRRDGVHAAALRRPARHAADRRGVQARDGATVLRDRRMVRFTRRGARSLMVCGYGSIEAGLPLFVTSVAHLSVHVVGLLVVFNTFTIIVAQLFVLGGVRGQEPLAAARARRAALGRVVAPRHVVARRRRGRRGLPPVPRPDPLRDRRDDLAARGARDGERPRPRAPARAATTRSSGIIWGVAGALGAPIAGPRSSSSTRGGRGRSCSPAARSSAASGSPRCAACSPPRRTAAPRSAAEDGRAARRAAEGVGPRPAARGRRSSVVGEERATRSRADVPSLPTSTTA